MHICVFIYCVLVMLTFGQDTPIQEHPAPPTVQKYDTFPPINTTNFAVAMPRLSFQEEAKEMCLLGLSVFLHKDKAALHEAALPQLLKRIQEIEAKADIHSDEFKAILKLRKLYEDLKKSSDSSSSSESCPAVSPKLPRATRTLISASIQDAFREKETEANDNNKKARIAALSNIATALITAAVMLAIHFSECQT